MKKVMFLLAGLALGATSIHAREAKAQTETEAAPAAAEAQASQSAAPAQNKGWDGTWALAFALNPNFMAGGLGGDLAASYNLSSSMAVRLSVGFNRWEDPAVTSKTTVETGNQKTITYTKNIPNDTSTSSLGVAADLVFRLLPSAVAPYAGAGLFYNWNQSSLDYEDDVTTPNQITTVNNHDRLQTVGLRGILGAEWRVHESFALFAEYRLGVNVYQHLSNVQDRTDEVKVGDQRTASNTKTEAEKAIWLTGGADLSHTGTIGLAVLF